MKRIGSILVLVFAATALLAPSIGAQTRQQRERAKNLQDAGDKALQQKKYREAIDKYTESLGVIANNAYAHFWKGTAYYYLWQEGERIVRDLEAQRRNETNSIRQANLTTQIDAQRTANQQAVKEALSELTIALSQGFRALEVHRLRAFIYYETKYYDAALDEIKRGLVYAPKDLQFLKGLGEVQLARRAYPEALAALKNAEQVAPNDADILYNLARVHAALKDVKAQQAAAEAALAKGTRFPGDAYYLLGDAHRKQRNAAGAIDALQKAIAAKPDLYQAYRDLADVFRNENRFADAIDISKKGLLAFPSDGGFYTDLSLYYSLADRPEDAVAAGRSAIMLLPNQYTGYTNLCRAYNETRQYDLAITTCNNALRLQPGDGETYFYLGRAVNLTGKTTEATRYYGLAVKGLLEHVQKFPEASDGWYLLGNAYFADNQRDKAIEAFLKCLDLAPKFAKARYNLGIVYTRKNNKPGAQEQYSQLLALDTRLAQALKTEIDKM